MNLITPAATPALAIEILRSCRSAFITWDQAVELLKHVEAGNAKAAREFLAKLTGEMK